MMRPMLGRRTSAVDGLQGRWRVMLGCHPGIGTIALRQRAAPLTTATRQCAQPERNATEPVTPDFTTSVNVAEIQLARPEREKVRRRQQQQEEGQWAGLAGLDERIKRDGSLVDSTLAAMETDKDFQLTASKLRRVGAKRMSLEERKKRRRALESLGVPDFVEFVQKEAPCAVAAGGIGRAPTEVLQLNIGIYCNMACSHCHVESSPRRTEHMSAETAEHCLALLERSPSVHTLDLTGGAPELQPAFRSLVAGARERAPHCTEIIDRCNLTVLSEPGQEDLPAFLAEHRVRVVASLPCYARKNVDQQRGAGVFERSVAALRTLNGHGFGVPGTGLHLDLVYNPNGGFLPPPQQDLEDKYREELLKEFGVEFSQLFTMTNMPIKRFADFLHRRGELVEYMDLLVRNFNADTIPGLMCRTTASVNYDGQLFDCDFNQQLGMGLYPSLAPPAAAAAAGERRGLSVHELASLSELTPVPISFDTHCFGCSAGMGSS